MNSPADIKNVRIEDLILDPLNPRLPEGVERTPEAMLEHIAKSTAIEDLMSAIAENGFFPGEPLIVIPELDRQGKQTSKYIVVEGNRRLTAVKLLLDPNIYSKPSPRIVSISQSMANKPTELPVVERKNREEVLPYLGFRHITGVKQWEPLSKARYIEQLFNLTDPSLTPNERYIEVARKIGSRRDHIKRSLDALAVYKIIEENDFFSIDDLDEESIKFSILSTALADEKIGFFVGILKKDNDIPSSNNVIINKAGLKYDEIKELTCWLYEKDSKGRTRVGESRNIRELSAVISSERALSQLRNGAALKIAYQLTSNLSEDLLEMIYTAENALREASSIVATTEYEESAVDSLRRISQYVKLVYTTLLSKQSGIDDGI